MHATARRGGWLTAAIPLTLLMLAKPASAQTKPADTQAPRSEGNRSDWRQWQPKQAQVTRREEQAGIAPSPAQRQATARELQQVNRELGQANGPRLSAPQPPTR